MVNQVSRRDRKKAQTQRELIEATRQLIVERGVTELRVADITERIDVALGTFYSYFPTKDDIVEAVVADVLEPLADAVGDFGDRAEDPAVATAVGVRELVRICDVEPDVARLLVQLDDAERRFERMIWDRAAPIIVKAVESGRFLVAGNEPELAARVAIAVVYTAIRARVEQGGSDADPGEVAVLALQLLGIAHPEAVEISTRDLPEIAGSPASPVE